MMEKEEKWLFALAIILLITDFLIVLVSNIIPQITLKDGNIILNLGDTFEEPGYYASRAYYDMTKQVLIEDNINTNKIGSYKVTYTIYYQGQAYQKIRYVTVLDQTPPTITLKGNTTVTVCPNKKYQEEGYESIDNYDGDLTKEVETEINKDFIQYSVKYHSDLSLFLPLS